MKCPYCEIGWNVMCTDKDKFVHMDIMWSSEAGLQLECKYPEGVISHIEKNSKYGTGYHISKSLELVFGSRNDKFHADPSPFSKETVSAGDFALLIGEFVRYSEYMDDKKVKEEVRNDTSIITKMYEEGKNMLEVMEFITEPDNDI